MQSVEQRGKWLEQSRIGIFTEQLERLLPTKSAMLPHAIGACLDAWGFEERDQDMYDMAWTTFSGILSKPWDIKTQDSNVKAIPRRVAYSQEQSKVIMFFGFSNEDEFKLGTSRSIEDTFIDRFANQEQGTSSNGALLQKVRDTISFAEVAYASRKPRKSGESYYCHVLRVAKYTIDFLTNTQGVPCDPQTLLDALTVSFLHDGPEDVSDLKIYPHVNTVCGPGDTFDSPTDYAYTIPVGRGGNHHKLRVSQRAHTAISAMSSPEMETDKDKFKKVIKDSSWPITAVIKNMDRLDNMLTYKWSAKNSFSYFYKLLESASGMAALDNSLDHNPNWKGQAHPPGMFCAIGLWNEAIEDLRVTLMHEMRRLYGVNLHRDAPIGTIFTLDRLPNPDIRNTLECFVANNQNGGAVKPFDITSLNTYRERVMNSVSGKIAYGNPIPGYGKHPFCRDVDELDEATINLTKKQKSGASEAAMLAASAIMAKLLGADNLPVMAAFGTSLTGLLALLHENISLQQKITRRNKSLQK